MFKEGILEFLRSAKDETDTEAVFDYKVQNDHCIVAPIIFKNESNSGVITPTQYEDKNEYGAIVAMGDGRVTETGQKVEPKFKVGDTVLYGQYSYTQLRVNGFDLNIIRHDDIIAVLPTKKT